MNKKIIFSVLAILITLCLALTGCGANKEDKNKEVAKLVDEYAPFEFTIKYPKDAGYKFEADLENTPYVAGKLINEERNIKISFNFSKTYESSMKKEKENKSSKENYTETNYTELGGYEYYDKLNYYGANLLSKNEEGSCLQVIVKIGKNKNNGADLDVTEYAKSEELKNILKSMTLNDKIEGKKIDGTISSNHKLIVKKLENPDESKYYVNQYPDTNGVTNIYALKEVNKYKGEGAFFRLTYYGNEGNYKDLDTCLAYQEKTFKMKFEDYTLFGQKVKVDVSRHAIGETSSPEKYKTWIAGYFEKDGKVYDFLYIQYVGVDDSLGEKLINNVLNNFTTQD